MLPNVLLGLKIKNKNPSIISRILQMSALPSSPHQAPPQRRASAHACMSRCKGHLLRGGCFHRLCLSTSGEGAGAANGVFPFTDKVMSNVAVSGRCHLVEGRPPRQFYLYQWAMLTDNWIYEGFNSVWLCMFAVKGSSLLCVPGHFLQFSCLS